MSELKHTQLGFAYIEFQDHYDNKCSLQKSSLAFEDAIWFGIDDANPQVMAIDAKSVGVETEETTGWVPYKLPAAVSLTTRMHLTQDQVRELLPTLIHFAETGDVLAPADCRTQPEATKPAQDLRAAILRLQFEDSESDYKDGYNRAIRAAAALASPADTLVAGDKVDSANVVKLTDEQYLKILEPVLSRYGMQRYLNGDEITLDPSDYRAIINAAIQAQKDGHG